MVPAHSGAGDRDRSLPCFGLYTVNEYLLGSERLRTPICAVADAGGSIPKPRIHADA